MDVEDINFTELPTTVTALHQNVDKIPKEPWEQMN